MADRPAKRGAERRSPDDDPMAAGLRRSIELLWGVEKRPARGPKPGLTIEGIVAVAVELADREGLAALSMARIAKELGFTTMSLYRYVQSKDELMMLMVDAGLGAPPAMDDIGDDWRAGLARWARACMAAFLAHPWSVKVPVTGPPIAPNNVAWLNACLEALTSTALEEQEKANIVLLISGFVRNEANMTRDLSESDDPQMVADGPRPTYGDALRIVATADQFPALFRTIESGAFDDGGEYGDEEFEFGLATLLDGVAVLVERRAPASSRGRRDAKRGAKRDARQASRGASSSSSG